MSYLGQSTGVQVCFSSNPTVMLWLSITGLGSANNGVITLAAFWVLAGWVSPNAPSGGYEHQEIDGIQSTLLNTGTERDLSNHLVQSL